MFRMYNYIFILLKVKKLDYEAYNVLHIILHCDLFFFVYSKQFEGIPFSLIF